MKKLLSIFMVLIAALVLASCGRTYEIAMVTDTGDIDDGSFNQGTWEGIKQYADEHNKSYQYYKPGGGDNPTNLDYEAAVENAIKGGAKIVITPGYLFQVAIYNLQDKYPNVKFVLIDAEPNNDDWSNGSPTFKTASNTLAILFQEEQAGFLAGYAAVKDGFTKLGFAGGMKVPAVQRFGIGWYAGAHYAANEDNITIQFNAAHYEYLGTFGPSDEYKAKVAGWYNSGVEIVHAAAGGAGFSVIAAAKEVEGGNKWVVGVDKDQAADGEVVISSAIKGVGEAAYEALEQFYSEKGFVGGRTLTLGADLEAVGLPKGSSFKFRTFTEAQYDAIFAKLKTGATGHINVPATADELETFITGLGFTLDAALKAYV